MHVHLVPRLLLSHYLCFVLRLFQESPTTMASVAAPAAKSAWSRLGSVPARYPFYFGVFFSGFKTSFSDLLVQKVVEQREQIDWRRNSACEFFSICS
jgi:hypothetical protein